MKPRISGDAGVSPSLMPLLRVDGYDAVSCLDLGWGEESDEWHLVRVATEHRIVLTYNVRDFRRLAMEFSKDGRHHAGIIASYHQYRRNEVGILHQLLRSSSPLEHRTTSSTRSWCYPARQDC